MFKEMLENVREKAPLVHNITNYVTVNDCANALLACGASPIMADDPREVEEIAALCGGLNLNIGTLNERTASAMFLAGRRAGQLGHPVLLDPVGAGASRLRTETARALLKEVRPWAVRGNISEVKALFQGAGRTQGVDAAAADRVTQETLPQALAFAKNFARETGAVAAITGAIDIVADAERAYVIYNGHPMMGRITGTGCMLSAVACAFLAANPQAPLQAMGAAVSAMGLCGERAHARLGARSGNFALRGLILDELYNLTGDELEKGAKYEVR